MLLGDGWGDNGDQSWPCPGKSGVQWGHRPSKGMIQVPRGCSRSLHREQGQGGPPEQAAVEEDSLVVREGKGMSSREPHVSWHGAQVLAVPAMW